VILQRAGIAICIHEISSNARQSKRYRKINRYSCLTRSTFRRCDRDLPHCHPRLNAGRHITAQHCTAVLVICREIAGICPTHLFIQFIDVHIRGWIGNRRHADPIRPGRHAIANASDHKDHLATFRRLDQTLR
jgi:hypothetical protein